MTDEEFAYILAYARGELPRSEEIRLQEKYERMTERFRKELLGDKDES